MPAPYSISLLEQMHKSAPPLVPEEIKEDLEHAIVDLKNDPNIKQNEVEETMIEFGKMLWPYAQAFQEFFKSVESAQGDDYIRVYLDETMQQWFDVFKKQGGTLANLKRGELQTMAHLNPEERSQLTVALIEMRKDLIKATSREVIGHLEEQYKKRILEFKLLLEDIEARLDYLRDLAQKEKRHPALAHELDKLVREFELSLCGLRPASCLKEIHSAEEHFNGRKYEVQAHIDALEGPFLTELDLPEQVNLFE